MMRRSGSVADKLGAGPTMIYGFILSGLTTALYPFSFNLPVLLAISAWFGVATSLIMPAQVSLAVESSDPKHRGLSMGIYRIFSDIGLIIGPLLSGLLIEYLPIAYAFYFIAGLCFFISLFIYLLQRSV
jgi:MFS family permease